MQVPDHFGLHYGNTTTETVYVGIPNSAIAIIVLCVHRMDIEDRQRRPVGTGAGTCGCYICQFAFAAPLRSPAAAARRDFGDREIKARATARVPFGMMSSLVDQRSIDGYAVSIRRTRQTIVARYASNIVERSATVAPLRRKCGSLP
jgi:hypothetical protein